MNAAKRKAAHTKAIFKANLNGKPVVRFRDRHSEYEDIYLYDSEDIAALELHARAVKAFSAVGFAMLVGGSEEIIEKCRPMQDAALEFVGDMEEKLKELHLFERVFGEDYKDYYRTEWMFVEEGTGDICLLDEEKALEHY